MECVYVGGPWDGKRLPYAMAPDGREVICSMAACGGRMDIEKYIHRPGTEDPKIYDYLKETRTNLSDPPEFGMLRHVLES